MTATRSVHTIAVDLTPVLPGGDNGGAKVFVVELLRRLAATAPQWRFILLTQAASHDELAMLDAPNVSRQQIVEAGAASSRPRLAHAFAFAMRFVPARWRRGAGRIAYRAHSALKRHGSARLLRAAGADLLFCPFTAPTFREPGIPTVCTVYDLQYLVYPEFFAIEDWAQREGAFLDACRNATLLAAISEFTRAEVLRNAPVDASRIRAIPLRIARRAVRDERHQVLARVGVAPRGYLLYPANFWRHKNHEMLLVGFTGALGRIDAAIKLVLSGAGGERQELLREAARRMGLEGRVVFAGFLPEADLVQLMANASGLVFPSLYEGFGLPVAEAMALGIPVACGRGGALPEVAGDATLLFDARVPAQVTEAIVALVNDEMLRSRLIAAGEARAAQFTDVDRMINEYRDLLVRAIGKR